MCSSDEREAERGVCDLGGDTAGLHQSASRVLPRMDKTESWPYTRSVYFRRAVWLGIYKTVWPLCWKRFHHLRSGLLRTFGARIAGRCYLSRSAWVEMPWQLELGEHVTLSDRVILYNLGDLKIGSHTVLSQDVYVCGGTHDYSNATYPLIRTSIEIGAYVWIAAGAFIGPGVKVGEGAVVAARSVVVRDVPPWAVVGGNPARFIKPRVMKGAVEDVASGESA